MVVSLDYHLTHASAAGSVCPSIKDYPQNLSSVEDVADVFDVIEGNILAVVKEKGTLRPARPPDTFELHFDRLSVLNAIDRDLVQRACEVERIHSNEQLRLSKP